MKKKMLACVLAATLVLGLAGTVLRQLIRCPLTLVSKLLLAAKRST